jgi:hypothetical protein
MLQGNIDISFRIKGHKGTYTFAHTRCACGNSPCPYATSILIPKLSYAYLTHFFPGKVQGRCTLQAYAKHAENLSQRVRTTTISSQSSLDRSPSSLPSFFSPLPPPPRSYSNVFWSSAFQGHCRRRHCYSLATGGHAGTCSSRSIIVLQFPRVPYRHHPPITPHPFILP